jgi:hypothetical protein
MNLATKHGLLSILCIYSIQNIIGSLKYFNDISLWSSGNFTCRPDIQSHQLNCLDNCHWSLSRHLWVKMLRIGITLFSLLVLIIMIISWHLILLILESQAELLKLYFFQFLKNQLNFILFYRVLRFSIQIIDLLTAVDVILFNT